VRQKFESRKESFVPVDSSIRRYARLFLLLLQPFHRQTRLGAEDIDWLTGARGMPRSEAAIRHIGEAVQAIIPYLKRIETEWERLYKEIAESGIKLPEDVHEQTGKLFLEVSQWTRDTN
jgi:hypothetical protein